MIRWLKKITPRALYARFLLMILLPMVLAQCIAVYMFYERHLSSMSRNIASSVSGEIAYVVYRLQQTAPENYPVLFDSVKQHMDLEISQTGKDAWFAQLKSSAPWRYQAFEKYTRKRIGKPMEFAYLKGEERIRIRIALDDSTKLYIGVPRKRLANPSTYIFILWMTGSSLLLTLVSVMFLKNQVRSIVRLALAAERFGRGQDLPDFKPEGAKEVRRAAIAFIEMRERIKRLLSRRTQMLAGVSHDLRTPLTRMNLQLEMMRNSKAVRSLKEDVQEMQKMLDGYLDFARGESGEQAQEIDLKAFMEHVVGGYKKDSARIHSNFEENIHLTGQNFALRRCVTNLLENGLRYAPEVWISTRRFANEVHILVEDNGSGIAESEHEQVFQPFYRMEKSRNVATGGVGLGLSIARDIAHRHGGEIYLSKSNYGGLSVKLVLPQ